MANHSKKIAKDTEQFEMELMSKYQKKKLFNDNIKEQIKQNVSNHVLTLQEIKKKVDLDIKREYKNTSFGPEEGKTEQSMMLKKKYDQISQVRGVLDSQTASKKEIISSEKILKAEIENLENS